jgi:selenocysteine lyase/cysteine desulfurase
VRGQFDLSPSFIHLGGLLLASHPAPVREAIEAHRRGLDQNPVHYLESESGRRERMVVDAAAAYLGVDFREIALTDSTTMGLGLLYGGISVRPDQELLTTRHDFYATHESLRYRAAETGASVRQIPLYAQPASASADEMVDAVAREIGPRSRVLAITWVHSSTGVKLPIRQIADVVAEANAGRDVADRLLLCVDGVHALGVEPDMLPELGCDFLVAGCHKWLFGPRGTGIVWGRDDAWPNASPTIPTFSNGSSPGGLMTPGGFHSFEHRWALAEAFEFHRTIGKARVAERIHELAAQLKDGLAAMPHVTLRTPRDAAVSAGLVCFDVRGLAPRQVVARLRERAIIATVTPYSPQYARLAPGLLNTPVEIDAALAAIRSLG